MLETGTIAAFGLFLVRTSAFVLATPFFGSPTTFGGAKVGWIASLALVSFSASGVPVPAASAPGLFAAFALREVLIGLALGFVLQMTVLAVRVAGEMIGSEMVLNMASVVDPANGVNTPLVTQIYEGLFLLGLFAVNGHHLLIRALAISFERAPVGRVGFDSSFAESATTLLSDLFAAGVTFAAPVLVLLILSSILVGLVARTMPQANVMEIGFSLRILAGLAAMLLFVPLVAPALGHLYGLLDQGLQQALAAVER